MNSGAFGENFPYSNFHDLNMDWIIKIAKDFLDQYTHIQEIIEQGKIDITSLTDTGLQQLSDKKDELQALLQAWYDTHSEDIANELSIAIQEFANTVNEEIGRFNTLADAKVASALASIPTDYTEMYDNYETLRTVYERDILEGENAFPLTTFTRLTNSNSDVTKNENGTLTFGNTDYGYAAIGPVTLSPGTYKLCPMPRVISNAYVYLSSTPSYVEAFERNTTTQEMDITITNQIIAYLGIAITSRPVDTPFTIRPYLTKSVPMSNRDNFYNYNGNYNLNNMVLNKYISKSNNVFKNTGTTKGVYINADGTLGTNASYRLSDYFSVKPDTNYFIANSAIDMCFYDHTYQYISGISPSINTTIRTPKNAFYARASTNVDPINWAIFEGTADTGEEYYEPYLMSNPYSTSPYYKGNFLTLDSDFNEFYAGYLPTYNLGLSYNTKYKDVIRMFDKLRNESESGYITKRSIGTAEGTDEDGDPYTIYEYIFKPRNIESPLNTPKHIKILINCAIHGFEKNSTFGMYCLLYDVAKNWTKNKFLNTLHTMVEIHVVPVANPWGFDRDVYYNANSVNINRNFPCENWQSGDHTGTAPLDQSETRAIANWVDSNRDMLVFIDTHTNGHYYVSSYQECNANMPFLDTNDEYYNKLFTAIKRHIEQQTVNIPAIIPEVNPTFVETLGRYQAQDGLTQTNGYADLYVAFTQKSAIAMTLEGCNGINVHDEQQIGYLSPTSHRLNSIIFASMIQELLIEYCK